MVPTEDVRPFLLDHGLFSTTVSSTPAATFSFADTQAAVPKWHDDEYPASINPSPALLVEARASDSSDDLGVSSIFPRC